MRSVLILVVFLFSISAASANEAAVKERESIAELVSITFLGTSFELHESQSEALPFVYEFFPEGTNIDAWDELVDFRVYPIHPEGNKPIDHAMRTAALFKQQYPHMRFALYSDKKTGAALLDFFYPTSARTDADFYEFNAFKFFSDDDSEHVISFHYANNIPAQSETRDISDVSADIKKLRQRVVPAIAALPLFGQ